MKRTSRVSSICAITLLSFITACDSDMALNKAFAKIGLTRLALVRTDIRPGSVFVSKDKTAIFADNITDYITDGSITTEFEDASKKVSGYIPQIDVTQKIEPKLALDLISTVMPIGGTANFSFATTVSVKQMSCNINRIPVPTLREFISKPSNAALSEALEPYFEDGDSVFIAVEVWRSSAIELNSESNTDITTDLKVGEVKPISKASASFTVTRTSKEKLTVSGDQPYAFAVKLAKLERDSASGNLSVKLTKFRSPLILQSPDDEIVFADSGFQKLDVASLPKKERLSYLKRGAN